MTDRPAVRAVTDARLELGEGARWVDGRLVLVDILAGTLYELVGMPTAPLRRLLQLDIPLGAVAPVQGRPGSWITAAGTGIALIDAGARVEWLARPEDAASGRTRMNDGVADPAGRFWAGSMAYDGASPLGHLYRVDPDGSVHTVLSGLTICNGPAFTPDGTRMFVADTPHRSLRRFSVAADGELADEVWLAIDPDDHGFPDGMTVDHDGRLWVAFWGSSEVRCLDPEDGRVLLRVALPASQPTSVCLAEGQLIVTSAALGVAPDESGAGEVYLVDLARVPFTATAAPAASYRPEA